LHGKNTVACDKVQTLILVEDVDILFPEDRGCIAAIQQIAETARGPIILTSNSDNPGLPDNFDRLHVSFSLPTPKELLSHLYSVCARGLSSFLPQKQ
ncbi:ATPase family AAA domain-containing protein, partial [Trifolium medium]|nr:ATPase family AAA domain-containing protein [Trifolium medium]